MPPAGSAAHRDPGDGPENYLHDGEGQDSTHASLPVGLVAVDEGHESDGDPDPDSISGNGALHRSWSLAPVARARTGRLLGGSSRDRRRAAEPVARQAQVGTQAAGAPPQSRYDAVMVWLPECLGWG